MLKAIEKGAKKKIAWLWCPDKKCHTWAVSLPFPGFYWKWRTVYNTQKVTQHDIIAFCFLRQYDSVEVETCNCTERLAAILRKKKIWTANTSASSDWDLKVSEEFWKLEAFCFCIKLLKKKKRLTQSHYFLSRNMLLI